MFKKGRKREAKGLAVVYFIIGLIILLIILAVIYFALVELDYSDRIKDPDATIRAYVEMTPDPAAFDADADDEDGDAQLDVDLTVPTEEPRPTPTATPEPTPTPSPEPTPTPTPLPPTMLALARTSDFKLPQAAVNAQGAVTKCYVSIGDDNKYMYLAGYAFLNEANYDCAQSQLFLVVSQSRTNQLIAYQATMKAGISGVNHDTAMCKNPANADFEVAFDVSQLYTEDIYNLGVVIGYKRQGQRKATYVYYALPSDVNFTVLAGQVVEPVKVPGSDDAGNDADVASDFANAGGINTGFDTSEPEDLVPEGTAVPQNTFIPAAGTQQPTLENAAQTDISAIQEQIYANQMGIG